MLIVITTPTDSRSNQIMDLNAKGAIKKEVAAFDFRTEEGIKYLDKYPEYGVGTVIDTETGNEVFIKDLLD